MAKTALLVFSPLKHHRGGPMGRPYKTIGY
jgi:hypothetical protein